jgi:hypothetical protein
MQGHAASRRSEARPASGEAAPSVSAADEGLARTGGIRPAPQDARTCLVYPLLHRISTTSA